LPGREPESAGQSEVPRCGGNGDWGGTVLDQRRHFLRGAEIGLVDDAGLAVDAGAVDDVIIELVTFLLGDE
jgi:hypothetical protein